MNPVGESVPALLPIIISSGPDSLPIAVEAARYYGAALPAMPKLILLRPRRCAGSHDVPAGTVVVDDEDIPGFAPVRARLDELGERLRRFGRSPVWYLQQYLKLACVRHLAPDGAIVTDGDTVFSSNLLGALLQSQKVLTTKEKFANYNRLIEALGISVLAESCVANGNVFHPARLPLPADDANGFLDIIERYVVASDGALDFSEYQMMGSVCAPMLGTHRIRMFRRFDLLTRSGISPDARTIASALRRYDAIAIEHGHHRSRTKQVVARLLYAMHYSW